MASSSNPLTGMGTLAGGGGSPANQAQPGPSASPAGNGSNGPASAKAILDEFTTTLAQPIKAAAEKYPEFQESAAEMLKAMQKGMTRIVGNPERVPERETPPNA